MKIQHDCLAGDLDTEIVYPDVDVSEIIQIVRCPTCGTFWETAQYNGSSVSSRLPIPSLRRFLWTRKAKRRVRLSDL